MMPQIQELANCSDEKKQQMIDSGVAAFVDGKMYLSLPAVNALGEQVVRMNPLVQVGKLMEDNKIVRVMCADPDSPEAVAVAGQLTREFFDVLRDSIMAGIPLYQCFNAFMSMVGVDGEPDYQRVLADWKVQVTATMAAQQQASNDSTTQH